MKIEKKNRVHSKLSRATELQFRVHRSVPPAEFEIATERGRTREREIGIAKPLTPNPRCHAHCKRRTLKSSKGWIVVDEIACCYSRRDQ